MTRANQRHGRPAGRAESQQPRARQAGESIPPQNEVSGGPQTPLELGGTGWKDTAQTSRQEVRP